MTEWVDEDELTITYRTLKQGMAEAVEAERERIIALFEEAKRGLKFGDDRALVENMIALIERGTK